jgi:cytidylate kinase
VRDRHIKDGIKIAISGKSGCGNSTVSRIVANRLGLRLVNYTVRALA